MPVIISSSNRECVIWEILSKLFEGILSVQIKVFCEVWISYVVDYIEFCAVFILNGPNTAGIFSRGG